MARFASVGSEVLYAALRSCRRSDPVGFSNSSGTAFLRSRRIEFGRLFRGLKFRRCLPQQFEFLWELAQAQVPRTSASPLQLGALIEGRRVLSDTCGLLTIVLGMDRMCGVTSRSLPPARNLRKRVFASSLRHKKPVSKSSLKTEAKPPKRCKKGENCTVCAAGGSRNAAGKCVYQAQVLSCPEGQLWNGFACGMRYLVNDCSALAAQLAQQERQVRSLLTTQQQSCSHDSASQECADLQGQYGRESLRHRQLREQYDQCMAHSRSYAFRGTPLLGASWVPRDDY